MKIVYMGTPDFAVAPLKKLLEYKDDFNVLAVITNKDKPVGRKKILTPPPVKQTAQSFNIPVYQYDKIRFEGVEDLKRLAPDICVTCAFGQILSKEILDIPKFGVINIHGSLLPKYRGASPVQYAVLNGDRETGVTVMQTEEGIDTGDIILQKKVAKGEEETSGELFERLSQVGADALIEALTLIKNGRARPVKQDGLSVTLTKIIKKEDAIIDFSADGVTVCNRIRGYNPWPVAYTFFNGEPLKIFSARPSGGKGKVGEVIASGDRLEIACGEGSITVLKLQKSGGNIMSAADFLRGNKIPEGYIFK